MTRIYQISQGYHTCMKHKIRFRVKIKDKDLKLRLIIRVKFLNQGSGAPTKYNGQDQSQWSQSELKNTTRFMGHITKHWGLNFSINTWQILGFYIWLSWAVEILALLFIAWQLGTKGNLHPGNEDKCKRYKLVWEENKKEIYI